MFRNAPFALVAALSGTILLATSATADDWPNWRGPNHDGISPEKGFAVKWDAAPPVVWQKDLGSAFSAFVCVDGKAYTCGTKDKQQVLFCLDASTGDTVWQKPFEKEYPDGQGGDGTRATPTVYEGRVLILGALGKLLCCDARTGDELWSHQFGEKPQWGYSASVLVEGGLAVVTAGGERGALLALDLKTGQEVWHAGTGKVAYSTPYPFTLGGRRYIVGLLAKEALIVEAKSGKPVCSIPWKTDWDVNAAAPIFHDGHLFLSSGYKTGSALFQLAPQGDQVVARRIWPAPKGSDDAPAASKVILGKFQSAVLHDGHLYVSEEKALKCVEFATGNENWSQRGISNGTVLLADGQLIVLTESGELQIAKVSPEKYEPTTKVELLRGKSWTIPTLYQGRLYARNLERAVCVNLTR